MKATHGWNMSLLVENGTVRGSNRSSQDAGRPSDLAYLRDVATAWMNSKSEARRRKAERHYRHVDFGVMFEAYVQPVDYEVQLFLFEGRFRLALVCFRPFVFENDAHQIYDEDWTLREASAAVGGAARALLEVPRPPASLFSRSSGSAAASTTCASTCWLVTGAIISQSSPLRITANTAPGLSRASTPSSGGTGRAEVRAPLASARQTA